MSKMGDRVRVIRDNYRMAKKYDPRLGWLLLGIAVLVLAIFVVIGVITQNPITWVLLGLSTALLAVAIVFSRRATRAAYSSIEGQPGAAVAIVQSQSLSRRGWGITPAVAVNKHQDLVHRAVGRPGVVLIGEGSSPALTGLMAAERKRTSRFVGEVPISEIVIGDEPGQVKISKLDKHLRKMNKVLAPGEVTALRKRLEALATTPLPTPKGPMPKGGRIPRGGKMR